MTFLLLVQVVLYFFSICKYCNICCCQFKCSCLFCCQLSDIVAFAVDRATKFVVVFLQLAQVLLQFLLFLCRQFCLYSCQCICLGNLFWLCSCNCIFFAFVGVSFGFVVNGLLEHVMLSIVWKLLWLLLQQVLDLGEGWNIRNDFSPIFYS